MPDGTFVPGTSEPGVIGSQLMGGVRAGAVSGGGLLSVPRSKFGCPAVPVRAVARPRLGEVLALPDWRVALVTGGPATGKTVAVAQWFGTLDPVAREWVTIDVGDDRPERFWLTFVLALERAVPGAFAQAAASAVDVHRLPPGRRTALEHALHDGEDYELLFTSSRATVAEGICIGGIVAQRDIWIEQDGQRQLLPPLGWEH